jgi:N-acetylmuramoyl-L-alanine amidase
MLKNKVPVLIFFAASHLLIFPAFSQTPRIKTIIVDAGHGGQDFGATGQYENSLRSKEKDVTLEISKKLVAELRRQLPDVNIVPTRTTDIYQNPREKAQIANDNKGNLFICIHADSGPLKTGHRQIGTRMVTRYKITHTGKGKKRKTIKTPYQVEEAVYEYFKMPLTRNGTSVWIFAAHKTSDKLKAIMKEIGDFDVEADGSDSTYQPFDINSTEGRNLANIYATRFQLRSDRLATFVNDEIEKTGRPALGVNQRQVGIWVLQATNMPAILVETGFINNPDDERYLNSDKGQQELAESITEAVKRYKDQVENSNKPLAVTTPEKPKDEKIIPQVYENRATKETKVLQVKSNKVKVEIYDDGEIDNDIVSVSFNKTMIVEGKALTAKPHTLNLELQEGKTNELVLYADNLGDIPPNTALMVITDGTSRYEVRLSADLKNNASIKFELKK